jgi:hypothetical protein
VKKKRGDETGNNPKIMPGLGPILLECPQIFSWAASSQALI